MRGLHFHREGAQLPPGVLLARGSVVEEVGGNHRTCGGVRPGSLAQDLQQGLTGGDPPSRAQGPAGPVLGNRLADHDQLPKLELGHERPARSDPDQAPRAEICNSEITIAALGPPIPVLWMVSGSPSPAAPV